MKSFLLIAISFMLVSCYGYSESKKAEINRIFYQVLNVASNTSCIIEKDLFFDKITLYFTFDDTHQGGVDEYGNPFVDITQIDVGHLILSHKEYSHISKDPEIGDFIANSEKEYWLVMLAHEVAHAIIYWNEYQMYEGGHLWNYSMMATREELEKIWDFRALGSLPDIFNNTTWDIDCVPKFTDSGHDKEWQHVYRKLRRRMNLVN